MTLERSASPIRLSLAILSLAILASCGTFPEYDRTPALLFQTGFAGTSIASSGSQTARFRGTDPDFESLSAWADLEGGAPIGTCLINYEAGTDGQRFAAIVGDPEDELNPAMEFRIVEPHIVELGRMKGRVSAILEGLSGVHGFSQTIRFRLDPGLAVLQEYDGKIDWLTFFEFWCGEDDRLTISLSKEAGAGKSLRWLISKESRGFFGWRREWEETATGDTVAFGAWMKLGVSVRSGEDGKARSWLGREENGAWTTLIETTKAVGKPSGFTKLNPFKLYTSDSLIEHVRDRGATLSVLWDDWKLWLNDGIGE